MKIIRLLRAVWFVLIIGYVSKAVLHADGRITNLIFVVGIPAALFYLQAHRCRGPFCGSWDTYTGWRNGGSIGGEKIRKCFTCGYEQSVKKARLLR